jgi:hypothetical protein
MRKIMEPDANEPLPVPLRGRRGLLFESYVPSPGGERRTGVYVLEDRTFAKQLSGRRELDARLASMLLQTDYGPVMVFVLSLFNEGVRIASYENYINPTHPDAERLLAELASQQKVHLLVFDSDSGYRTAMFEYGWRAFDFASSVEALKCLPTPEASNSFEAARAEAMKKYSLLDLVAMIGW